MCSNPAAALEGLPLMPFDSIANNATLFRSELLVEEDAGAAQLGRESRRAF
jgi:hypothetical protein